MKTKIFNKKMVSRSKKKGSSYRKKSILNYKNKNKVLKYSRKIQNRNTK